MGGSIPRHAAGGGCYCDAARQQRSASHRLRAVCPAKVFSSGSSLADAAAKLMPALMSGAASGGLRRRKLSGCCGGMPAAQTRDTRAMLDETGLPGVKLVQFWNYMSCGGPPVVAAHPLLRWEPCDAPASRWRQGARSQCAMTHAASDDQDSSSCLPGCGLP
eukprot:scaffold48_cov395-Prasinococcus_capsulatus_cf.AAC.24